MKTQGVAIMLSALEGGGDVRGDGVARPRRGVGEDVVGCEVEVEDVVAGAAAEHVCARTAAQEVVARAPEQSVVAEFAVQHVVAAEPEEIVAAIAAGERVVEIIAVQVVV